MARSETSSPSASIERRSGPGSFGPTLEGDPRRCGDDASEQPLLRPASLRGHAVLDRARQASRGRDAKRMAIAPEEATERLGVGDRGGEGDGRGRGPGLVCRPRRGQLAASHQGLSANTADDGGDSPPWCSPQVSTRRTEKISPVRVIHAGRRCQSGDGPPPRPAPAGDRPGETEDQSEAYLALPCCTLCGDFAMRSRNDQAT
jgi:hypothetical protein